jgi:hypothetical protein
MKQTSIEWLIDQLPIRVMNSLQKEIEQAKAMHKEEIKSAVGVGSQFDRDYLYGYHDKAEQYYNETFNTPIK